MQQYCDYCKSDSLWIRGYRGEVPVVGWGRVQVTFIVVVLPEYSTVSYCLYSVDSDPGT